MRTKILALLVLSLVGITANAATVIYSDPGIVTAIQGLDIDGTLYNVDFDDATFGTFGGATDYWNTAGDALAAVNSINALLNAQAVGSDPVADGTASAPLAGNYTVSYGPTLADTKAGFFNKSLGAGTNWSENTFAPQANTATAWSVVPVPAAVWLFGSALAGLGWMRRKASS